MAILTFAQSKGGSGKTTCTIATVAEFLARKQRVAIVDLDPGQPLATIYAQVKELAAIKIIVPPQDARLTKIVRDLSAEHDHIVIDLMGAATNETQIAMALSDLILIPSQLSGADLQCGLATWRQAQEAAEVTGRPIAAAVLMTRTASGAVRPRVEEHLRGQYAKHGVTVLGSAFGDRASWKEMAYSGIVPNLHDRESNASLNFQSIFDEMIALIGASKAQVTK